MQYPVSSYQGKIKSIFVAIERIGCETRADRLFEVVADNGEKFVKNLLYELGRDQVTLILALDIISSTNLNLLSGEDTKTHNRQLLQEIQKLNKRWARNLDEYQVKTLPFSDVGLTEGEILAFCVGEDGTNFTRWVQDLFWVLRDDQSREQVSLLVSEGISPHYEMLVTEFQKVTGHDIQCTPLPLEGGNILVGEDFMIVGRSHVYAHHRKTEESYEKILRTYGQQFFPDKPGQQVFCPEIGKKSYYQEVDWPTDKIRITGICPKSDQLIFHIDLFLTLGGKLPNGKQLIFVAQHDPEKHIITYPGNMVSKEEREIMEICAKWLDDVADWFAKETNGFFEVARIPILNFSEQGGGLVSYNNCLIEVISPDTRIAYLPVYEVFNSDTGKAIIHQEVESALNAYGIEAKWIEGQFRIMIDNGGSLHCRVKVLERELLS